jgi:ABC-2 type transport system ATP-binding protein
MKTPVIEITELSKYYGKTRGIEKVNLQISEGEIFGFIGPNGAGKSTTIRILLNLIFPDSGSAKIMGMDVIRKTKKIKELVGYVPSDANAYGYMTVLEFLQYCHRFYNLNDTLHRIGELSTWFELDLKRKISDLSMGNRKKVSIVQSLLHKPRLLILDEPTTGLDPLMQAKFFELLRMENQKGMTIFFSSHILNEVQMLCKRVAIIKEGKIIRVEEIENLRRKQLKKVILGLTGNWNTGNIILPGVLDLSELPGNRVSFMYSGEIPELITFLSGRMITDLTIEEPSLEEIFMHYYK